MPYKPWNNVQGVSNWSFGGYCTHSSVLFTTWHRPFLCLFEVSHSPYTARGPSLNASSHAPFCPWPSRKFLVLFAPDFHCPDSAANSRVLPVAIALFHHPGHCFSLPREPA